MKITISLEVPEGTSITTSNDSMYLSHADHPEYAETGKMKIPREVATFPSAELKHLRQVNEELQKMIAASEAERNKIVEEMEDLRQVLQKSWEQPLKVPMPPRQVPSQSFTCLTHGAFTAAIFGAQATCEQCGAICDLTAPPKDDLQSIPCIECGTVYNKSTGGKFGTCPKCTTVRCPTCKQPASLAEMNGGQKCKICRGEQ